MLNTSKHFLVAAGILGALAIALGAFGAHALKTMLDSYSLEVYTKAVTYHMYHVLALIGVAAIAGRQSTVWFIWTGRCFVIGIVLFSGSLYVLALTGVRMLGAVTPFGGLSFILGWICLAIGALKAHETKAP